MSLSEHIHAVIKRSRRFYNAIEPGHFLVNVIMPMQTPDIPPLYEFDLDRQLTEWLDYKLEAARSVWATKKGLADDTIPCICPQFGIAEHSAWLGMDVRYQQDTCIATPILEHPADIEQLNINEGTKWFQYMKRGYDYLRSKKDGTFVLCLRGTMAPMDMANALRGDELFSDFLLNPEWVHRLMKFLVRAIDWYFHQLCLWADKIDGGYIYYIGSGWIPGNCIGHLSNDAAMLCAPAIYDKFGFPYEVELTQNYDSVFYHVHNEKLHFVPKVATIPGLALLEVTNDPKTPGSLEDLPRVFAATGTTNLMLSGTSDQVRTHIDELKQRNIFLQVSCLDRKDAEDIIGFVRRHSRENS